MDKKISNRDLEAIYNFVNWLYKRYGILLTYFVEWYEEEMNGDS